LSFSQPSFRYGDIGQATAKLAKAYGMKVIAMRRHSQPDEHVDIMYGPDHLDTIFADSDYVVCAAPLTTATHKMIGVRQFAMAKPGLVFINVGRGPVVDETALIAALERSMQDEGPLKGAALDVFEIEPLPLNSKLWELDNVLLSPHNMDKTDTFMHESTEFFVNEQLPRFVRGLQLYNEVDCAAGY
jgi:phosphoglycerate dehydrogenase-like enzyme